MKSYQKLLLISLVGLLLGGCAATTTTISKRNLEVSTKMSATVFLNPVEAAQKTIYLQVTNTSDQPSFNITAKVKQILEGKGYTVVTSPNKAQYLLQVNILQVGKTALSAAEKAFDGGFGSSLASIGIGATTGALISNGRTGGMIAGGVIAGLVDTVANSVVKDVTYTVITDLQISERAAEGMKIAQINKTKLSQGSNGYSKQEANFQSGWMKYQTRVLSVANKVNLKFQEAQSMLEGSLANAVAGLF